MNLFDESRFRQEFATFATVSTSTSNSRMGEWRSGYLQTPDYSYDVSCINSTSNEPISDRVPLGTISVRGIDSYDSLCVHGYDPPYTISYDQPYTCSYDPVTKTFKIEIKEEPKKSEELFELTPELTKEFHRLIGGDE